MARLFEDRQSLLSRSTVWSMRHCKFCSTQRPKPPSPSSSIWRRNRPCHSWLYSLNLAGEHLQLASAQNPSLFQSMVTFCACFRSTTTRRICLNIHTLKTLTASSKVRAAMVPPNALPVVRVGQRRTFRSSFIIRQRLSASFLPYGRLVFMSHLKTQFVALAVLIDRCSPPLSVDRSSETPIVPEPFRKSQ